MRNVYFVTTEHPKGYMDGIHELTVRRNPVVTPGGGEKPLPETRYVTSAAGLGCSRDYTTPSDTVAIQNFLAEHGMRMVKMVKKS